MTEMKTLSHIKMLYQQQPNPEPLEIKLMASAAGPLLAIGSARTIGGAGLKPRGLMTMMMVVMVIIIIRTNFC